MAFHTMVVSLETRKLINLLQQTNETGQLEALKTLLEENERVKRYGFKASELKRAKKDYLARLERQFKNKDKRESNRIVNAYIQNFLRESPIPGIEWSYNYAQSELPSIKLDEVNGLISDFLHDDNRLVILTGPKKEGLTKVIGTRSYRPFRCS